MGFYNDVILPRLCDFAMRNKRLVPYRERVIGAAEGRVIEIGIGSGLNLPFYRPVVKEVLAIEPAPKLVTMARRAPRPEIRIKFIEASAEAIPIEDHSVDTVVTLDAVHHSASCHCACGNATRASSWRQAPICRTWPRA